jgi:hypothetical protein
MRKQMNPPVLLRKQLMLVQEEQLLQEQEQEQEQEQVLPVLLVSVLVVQPVLEAQAQEEAVAMALVGTALQALTWDKIVVRNPVMLHVPPRSTSFISPGKF